MANNVNTIISGLYEGATIKKSSTGKAAYIIANGGYQYINQQNVANITTVNKESVNNVMDASLGSAVFGTGGAVIGMNQKQILLEIHWKNGGKSLAKVDADINEAIVVGMYENLSSSQQEKMQKGDETANTISTIFGLCVFVFCVIIYCFPSAF